MGVFTWEFYKKENSSVMMWVNLTAAERRSALGAGEMCVTLETAVSMERDKLVWTSRVKQMCLSVVLISWTDGVKEALSQKKIL